MISMCIPTTYIIWVKHDIFVLVKRYSNTELQIATLTN